MTFVLSRRGALLGLTASFSLGRASLALAAAPGEKRFVVIILRGAMDGLSAVVPYGDPALASLRGKLLPPGPGETGGLLDLGGFFGLHPAMPNTHAMYQTNEVVILHAVAGAYRSRSHFEAQDYLESGANSRMTTGWLNRVVGSLPTAHGPVDEALAVGVAVPLLLRGPAPVGSWAPTSFAAPSPELYARIAALHRPDPITGPAIAAGLRERGFADGMGDTAPNAKGLGDPAASGNARYAFPALAAKAGRMLARPDGPRIAAMEIGGWDTHAAQTARLAFPLRQLDAGLAALKDALGSAWSQTAVLVMTEFGRTVRANGTKGTDHGTGTVAFALGGAIAGGRVLGTWPGLGPGRLLDDRDLAPTTDLRSVAKGLLAGHLGLNSIALVKVFPGSEAALPIAGLVRRA